MSKKKNKKHWGDKRDGRLIKGKELDTNHYIMPLCWPKRTDNEAFISQTFNLDAVDEFLRAKNDGTLVGRYSLFALIIAAYGKAFINRPKMNRFYRNTRLYERYRVSVGFIVKKSMSDDGDEALARVFIDPDDTLETLNEKVQKEIEICRSDVIDKSSDDVRILMKFPRFVGRIVMGFMKFIDRHWVVPESISKSDMFFCSIVLSNLGSIKLPAGYHHLSNWGTNSFFSTIGEKKVRPFYDRRGNMTLHDSIDIGFTIDERIADGIYYSNTIKLIKKYLEHPELLEAPFKDPEE